MNNVHNHETNSDAKRAHELLHRLWSKAVDGPGYVKDEWKEMETIMLRAYPDPMGIGRQPARRS